ncbi:MAG: aldehyde ferredoxin oxidoreductase [Actinobacteria bacterium]|nr:aldehyde ferredoxin oxidoreductase [Actinomycetota bacterium]
MKLLRISMTDGSLQSQPIPPQYQGLGGRALTSAIVAAEVPPRCAPLGPNNKLILAPGLLTGTSAACSGRLSAGGKSPLTGTIKESNAGGTASQHLARLGIAAIVVEGQPKNGLQQVLHITADGAKLTPADKLEGQGNYATVESLFTKFGQKCSIISIGQAGEMKLATATIAVTDPENRPTRHCGRGGLGAVMGSKGLKAVVIDAAGGKRPESADPKTFSEAARIFTAELKKHPVTSSTLPTYGTNALTNVINQAGALPTRNFTSGNFEGAEKTSGETQRDMILARDGLAKHACHPGCVIQCSRIYNTKKKEYLTKGPEYETVWAHGANCGIDDLDTIAEMDRLEDDIGVDTIETGATLAVAMAAGLAEFGDGKAAMRMVNEIAQGTPLGRTLGSGAEVTGKVFGISHVPTVKGQSMPAYDPRAVQGIGVTYATSTMGADHTAGYAVAPNILKVGGDLDPLKPDGQVEASRNLQVATAMLDSAGLCLFVAFCVLDSPAAFGAIRDMLNAHYGWTLSDDDLLAIGGKTLLKERTFNKAAGFGPADDRLPEFCYTEPLPPHNTVFQVTDQDLDQLFKPLEEKYSS